MNIISLYVSPDVSKNSGLFFAISRFGDNEPFISLRHSHHPVEIIVILLSPLLLNRSTRIDFYIIRETQQVFCETSILQSTWF